jgi:hypothetical protein
LGGLLEIKSPACKHDDAGRSAYAQQIKTGAMDNPIADIANAHAPFALNGYSQRRTRAL